MTGIIDRLMMRDWISPDDDGMNAELVDDAEARDLIRTHDLEVLFNSHATEPRWEVTCGGKYRCFSNEYTQPLGAAIRECVARIAAQ